MKKKYITPQMRTVLFRATVVLVSVSNTVNDYENGYDVNVGDEP